MRWKVVSEQPLYGDEWLDIRVADVELPDGRRLDHRLIRTPPGAGVAAVDDAGRVLLIWRHRFITDSWGWEIPLGKVEEGESPIQAAAREFEEETGWRAGPLRHLIDVQPTPGISDSRHHVYMASTATQVGEPDGIESERIEWIRLSGLASLIERGDMTSGTTLAALLYLQSKIKLPARGLYGAGVRDKPVAGWPAARERGPMATATRLTPQQRRSLKDEGYLLVPSLLGGTDLAPITARLAECVRQTVAAWAEEPTLDTHEGAVTIRFDLDDPGLAPCYQHPLVLDAAATVLADGWHLQTLGMRAPIPGSGEQGLHPDFAERGAGPTWQALSAMWCMSEFTRDSGPLRVIPGSHLVSEPPIDMEHGYATGMGPHPDEVKIIAPAGSVILFNSPDLWHSGTFNYTPAARMALTATFAPGPPWQLSD